MLKSKNALFGVAVAAIASALLLAGMAVDTASGQHTDGHSTDAPSEAPAPVAAPPQAPIEPPAPTDTAPPANPAGAPDSAGAGPGGLPSAGFGADVTGGGQATLIMLLSLAGAALVVAGATVTAGGRRE